MTRRPTRRPHTTATRLPDPPPPPHRTATGYPGGRPEPPGEGPDEDRGQTTAEYALVLLGAAAIALLVLAWAVQTDAIGSLLDFVLEQIRGRAS